MANRAFVGEEEVSEKSGLRTSCGTAHSERDRMQSSISVGFLRRNLRWMG